MIMILKIFKVINSGSNSGNNNGSSSSSSNSNRIISEFTDHATLV